MECRVRTSRGHVHVAAHAATTSHTTSHAGRALLIEACLAQDGAASFLDGARLERYLTRGTAVGADGIVHLTIRHTLALAVIAAILAALRGAEVAGSIKLLFTF